MFLKRLAWIPFVLVLGVPLLGGCGAGTQAPVASDPAAVDKAKAFRGFFDKAHGDYAQLSPADHAEYLKLVNGDEKRGEETWNMMKTGSPSAPAAPTAPQAPQ